MKCKYCKNEAINRDRPDFPLCRTHFDELGEEGSQVQRDWDAHNAPIGPTSRRKQQKARSRERNKK